MKEINITYQDVADYYSNLIRNGGIEFTKELNNLKAEGVDHHLSLQMVNLILDHKYTDKPSNEINLKELREKIQEEKLYHDIKITIFKYYVQMLNSFKDESTSIRAIAKNTGLSESTIFNFLNKHNKELELKYQENDLEKNIRSIFEAIWG